jgi:tRNA(Ile)-lysidine synthetase-like protein
LPRSASEDSNLVRFSPRPLGEEGPGVRGRVQNYAGQDACSAGPAVTYTEIESVRRLAREGQSGKRLQLACGVVARKEFEWLIVERAAYGRVCQEGVSLRGFSYRLQLPSEIEVPELGVRLRFRLADLYDVPLGKIAYTGWNGVWLDASQLSAPLILRNWHPGDRVGSAGIAKPLKLKELFQRRRIPIGQRPYWPVIEASSEIIWAKGFEAQFERQAPGRYRLLISEEQYRPDPGASETK